MILIKFTNINVNNDSTFFLNNEFVWRHGRRCKRLSVTLAAATAWPLRVYVRETKFVARHKGKYFATSE